MTFLVYYILLFPRTPSNGSLRLVCLIRSSLQFDFILYYEVTVLLRRWTFIVIGALQVCIVLYCIILYCIKGRSPHTIVIYRSVRLDD